MYKGFARAQAAWEASWIDGPADEIDWTDEFEGKSDEELQAELESARYALRRPDIDDDCGKLIDLADAIVNELDERQEVRKEEAKASAGPWDGMLADFTDEELQAELISARKVLRGEVPAADRKRMGAWEQAIVTELDARDE